MGKLLFGAGAVAAVALPIMATVSMGDAVSNIATYFTWLGDPPAWLDSSTADAVALAVGLGLMAVILSRMTKWIIRYRVENRPPAPPKDSVPYRSVGVSVRNAEGGVIDGCHITGFETGVDVNEAKDHKLTNSIILRRTPKAEK